MSIEMCSKCELPIDNDLQDGYYCPHCENFSCEECWDGLICPICKKETEI